jgi:hypothetical protein
VQSLTQAGPVSKGRLWTGRIISALVVLFLLFDSITKVLKVRVVLEASAQLGYPVNTIVAIGIILLVCTVFYIIPQTAVLGTILLTGYLGGAVAANLRIASPMFNTFFPIVFGVLAWVGIFLRESRLGALIPFRTWRRREGPKRQLKHAAGFVKAKSRVAREELAGIAVTDIAKKIGFPFAVGEKFRINFRLVESGHRAAIKAQAARGDHEVGALERTIAEGCLMNQRRIASENRAHVAGGKKLGEFFVKLRIPGDNHSDRRSHRFLDVGWRERRTEPLLGLGRS